MLAHLCREDKADAPNTITIIDIRTGDVIKIYTIVNPSVIRKSVSFCHDRLMLFCESKENDSACIYLLSLDE